MDEFLNYFYSYGGPVGIGLIILGTMFYYFVLRWFGAIMVALGVVAAVMYYVL